MPVRSLSAVAIAMALQPAAAFADPVSSGFGRSMSRSPSAVMATTPSEPAQVAVDALSSWLRERTVHFEVGVKAMHDTPAIVPAGAEYRARPLSHEMQPARRMPIWVDVQLGGRRVRSILVTTEVKALAHAWIANIDLQAGARLSPEDVSAAVVDAAAGGRWPSRVNPAGSRLRTAVLKGAYLRADQIGSSRAVERGQRVELVSRVGHVEIKADAHVLQDGRVGDRVAVRVPLAKGPVYAEVTGPGLTEIPQ